MSSLSVRLAPRRRLSLTQFFTTGRESSPVDAAMLCDAGGAPCASDC